MAERDGGFTKAVLALAALRGWRRAHFKTVKVHGPRGFYHATPMDGDKGFPDLVLVRKNRCLFVELKSGKGKLRVEQRGWLDALREAGQEAYLWRPEDWASIEKELE